MPAQRPKAAFEPIPPDFDINHLVESNEHFEWVTRVGYDIIANQSPDQLEKLVRYHVISKGLPLIIDGYSERLDPWIFTPKWLRDNHGESTEKPINLATHEGIPMTIKHYLGNLGLLTDQFCDKNKPTNYKDKNRQRIYLKDIDCPPVWQDKLRDVIPPSLYYWNETTGDIGGPGATHEPMINGSGRRKGRGIANAGDLMSSLPLEMRAQNLMCYIGHEGTYTPAHREMCSSLGQNIMIYNSGNVDEQGKPEVPGSSIWFMTEAKDRETVSEYWLSVLGHDIEVEKHFAQIAAWKKAPFKVYVAEQRAGDFILIPPMAPHQVWNRGTCTIKVAWNRTTVESLGLALSEGLRNARFVCRDEQYKNKAIVYYTLIKYSELLRSAHAQASRSQEEAHLIYTSKKVRTLQRDFKALFCLYRDVLLSEMFAPDTREHCEYLQFDSNVTCAYCRCNIFNRFLTCKVCKDPLNVGADEPYDVCMDCFIMGRSCACQSGYKWVEQFKWKELVSRYEEWRYQANDIEGEEKYLSLADTRRNYDKKTTAQICQEQLKIRPFVDVNKPQQEEEEPEEQEIRMNEDGTVKKVVRKLTKSYLNKHMKCHTCIHRHPIWKMATCTMCDRGWCYGSLWRAYDLEPKDVMENPRWECPHCLRHCATGACRKDPRHTPYEPKKMLLGHDTKKVADIRSVESLVDFSMSNLNWIRDSVDDGLNSSRIRRTQAEAEQAKLTEVDDAEGVPDGIVFDYEQESTEFPNPGVGGYIDPALGGSSMAYPQLGHAVDPSTHMTQGSYMMDGSMASVYPDLDPPNTYVAPTAVMYTPDLMTGVEPTNVLTPATNGNAPKRARDDNIEQIKLVAPKRRKVDEEKLPKNQNKATKQYQQEQDRKLLEQARKEGRFLYVWGQLNKKKLVVKLNLPKDKLAAFAVKEAAQRRKKNQTGADRNILVQSDIVPLLPIHPLASAANGEHHKKRQSYRARIESDDEFVGEGTSRRVKKSKKRFEEITVEDDSEGDDEENVQVYQERSKRMAARRRRGEDDDDAPSELPPNWKDRPVRVRQSTGGAANSFAYLERERNPKTKKFRRSTGSVPSGYAKAGPTTVKEAETVEIEDDENSSGDFDEAAEEQRPKDKAVLGTTSSDIAQDNMRAKLDAESWANDADAGAGVAKDSSAGNASMDVTPEKQQTAPPAGSSFRALNSSSAASENKNSPSTTSASPGDARRERLSSSNVANRGGARPQRGGLTVSASREPAKKMGSIFDRPGGRKVKIVASKKSDASAPAGGKEVGKNAEGRVRPRGPPPGLRNL